MRRASGEGLTDTGGGTELAVVAKMLIVYLFSYKNQRRIKHEISGASFTKIKCYTGTAGGEGSLGGCLLLLLLLLLHLSSCPPMQCH